jgi:carbon-monoxide dehydrogenase small subunit
MTDDRQDLVLQVNGTRRRVATEGSDTLLTVLRDQLGLTGTKRGCNQGVCGSCTVQVDGWPVRGCLSLASACEGHDVVTIEGTARDPVMAVLQRQFVERGAVQCGFCTTGMLISARRLLEDEKHPDVEQVQAALSGNICRCTGYAKIIDAVLAAAEELAR